MRGSAAARVRRAVAVLLWMLGAVASLTGCGFTLQGNYTLAALRFNEVERQHPYSVWATKAQLMSHDTSTKTDN